MMVVIPALRWRRAYHKKTDMADVAKDRGIQLFLDHEIVFRDAWFIRMEYLE